MKIMVSASNGSSLIKYRGELIKEMLQAGHEVVCTSVEPESEMKSKMKELGASYYCVPKTRSVIRMIGGLKLLLRYVMAIKVLKPDLCIFYMSRLVALGGIAAILCHVNRVSIFITGLESFFYKKGLKCFLLRFVLKAIYRSIIKRSEMVFFTNHSDYNMMLQWKLVKKEQAVIVNSGVNLNIYTKKCIPKTDLVCMTASTLWRKGVGEYIEAARIVRSKYPKVRFLLVGSSDEKQEAFPEEILDEAAEKGNIVYCGFEEDVRPYLEVCTIFVLPSYHEGNGHSIMEAEAVGRPIITTDASGCQEFVIDGYNGFLVPVRDGRAIAERIMSLLENEELKRNMAENSYRLCKENYDVRKVNQVIIEKMKL